MTHSVAGRGRRVSQVMAALMVTALGVLVLSGSASADVGQNYCPRSGGTQSIDPGTAGTCVYKGENYPHAVTIVNAYRLNNQNAVHCAGANQYMTPGSSHVISYQCGVGDTNHNGIIRTGYYAPGTYGYPIHKNDASITLSNFYGSFSYANGTRAAHLAAERPRPLRSRGTASKTLRRTFGVFAQRRHRYDRLGEASVGPAIRSTYANQTHLIPGPAQAADASGDGGDDATVWVAPGPGDRPCLLQKDAAAAGPAAECVDQSEAEAGKLVMTEEAAADDINVAGVVPDGVDRVHLLLLDGTVVDADVTDNVYRGHLGAGLASLTFDGPDGVKSFAFDQSEDAL